jgi:4-carboxymuconolactone decarboxylase
VTSRLAPLPPGQLDEAQAALYDAIADGRRRQQPHFRLTNDDGSLTGPFNAMLYAPTLGRALQHMGEVIRFESSIPPRSRELAILTVARHWRSDFEWYAHEPIALEVGLPAEVVEAIRAGSRPPLTDPPEAAVHDVCDALLRREALDDATYRRVHAALGDTGLVELTVLVGYYTTLAMLLETFRVGVPEDAAPSEGI